LVTIDANFDVKENQLRERFSKLESVGQKNSQ